MTVRIPPENKYSPFLCMKKQKTGEIRYLDI